MTLTIKPVSELTDLERALLSRIGRRDFTQDNVAWVSFDMPDEEAQVETHPVEPEPEPTPIAVEEEAPVEAVAPVGSEPVVEEGIPAEALVPAPEEA